MCGLVNKVDMNGIIRGRAIWWETDVMSIIPSSEQTRFEKGYLKVRVHQVASACFCSLNCIFTQN